MEVIYKKTWSVINELTTRKQTHSVIKEINCDELQLSSIFNEHFVDIRPKLASQIPRNANLLSHKDYLEDMSYRFYLKPCNPFQVFSLLSKLCKSKATGLDQISVRLAQECADLISVSLCEIFNHSIATGILPSDWKCSKVIPLFKEGERSDLDNYRLTSVVPIIVKSFERIIYDQLYDYLNTNHLLSNHQSGFRSLYSTVTALLEATDEWYYNIDEYKYTQHEKSILRPRILTVKEP